MERDYGHKQSNFICIKLCLENYIFDEIKPLEIVCNRFREFLKIFVGFMMFFRKNLKFEVLDISR